MASLLASWLSQVAVLVALVGVAWGWGWLAFERLTPGGMPARGAWRTAMGLGLVGSVLHLAGLAGRLDGTSVVLVSAVGAAGAVLGGRGAWRRAGGSVAVGAPAAGTAAPRRTWPLVAFVGASLAPAFVWSMYPPIAYDEVGYHLPFAKAFAESHGLPVLSHLLLSVFPQLAEVLFAALLLAAGRDPATHVVQWAAVALVAGLLVAWGGRWGNPRVGLWAAALWLAHPLVHYQAATAYVDALLALFCLAAWAAWERWREVGGWRWLALAGVACGFGAATKYLGLLWLGLLGLATLFAGWRERRDVPWTASHGSWRSRAGAAAVLGIAALAVAAPWYGRIARATGNPVHPYLASWFARGAAPAAATDLEGSNAVGLAPGDRLTMDRIHAPGGWLRDLAMAPARLPVFAWDATFRRERFGRQAPLAPWHLALLPLAAWWSWRDGDRRLRRLLLLCLAYACLWTQADPRYQFPALPLLALVGAVGLDRSLGALQGRSAAWARPVAAWSLAVALVAPGPVYAVYKMVKYGAPPPVDGAAREAVLGRQLPGYAALRALARSEPAVRDTRVLAWHAHELTYHFEGTLVGHGLGPFDLRRVQRVRHDASAMADVLCTMGVGFLLITEPEARRALPGLPGFEERFALRFRDDRADLYAVRPR